MKLEDKYLRRNRLLNDYYDIKNIFNYSTNILSIDNNDGARKISLLYNKKLPSIKNKEKKILKLKKFSFSKLKLSLPKNERIKFIKIHNYYKNNLSEFFSFFIVHGSFASLDIVPGWSDVDTFVVIKEDILRSKSKILKLRKKIKELYLMFKELCIYQHHGLILFSESDLKNYLTKYLPLEALKYNFDFDENSKIEIMFEKNKKKNHYLQYLINRHKYFKEAINDGLFKHHPFKNKFLKSPLKKNRKEMYQLFVLIGFFNNIPAYYYSSLGNAIDKKNSFNKFRKNYKNKFVNQFLLKGEIVRKNWIFYKKRDFKIPEWIINILGSDYINEGEKVLLNIIKKLKSYENK